jgi:periplasmic protein TorT
MFTLPILLALVLLGPFGEVHAQQAWYPYPVEVWDPPFNMDGQRRQVDYAPLEQAAKKWNIHVFFPHMKDSYWLAANFGVVSEARRLGISLTLHQAGGYDKLDIQKSQLEKALAAEVDAVIIGAISDNGLDSLITAFRARDIPVIDLINGISSSQLSAKSLVSFAEMGAQAGNYLARRHPAGSAKVQAAFFPGPQGAGWVKAGEKGFVKALAGSAVEVVSTRYGDTGERVQTQLLQETLDTHSNIDYIVGTAVSAEAAIKVIRRRKLKESIQIVSYYFNPGVYRGIRLGQILAAPTDATVVQGRIAVDQAIRLLEGEECLLHVGPRLQVIDRGTIGTFNQDTSLAPRGFRATYSVH